MLRGCSRTLTTPSSPLLRKRSDQTATPTLQDPGTASAPCSTDFAQILAQDAWKSILNIVKVVTKFDMKKDFRFFIQPAYFFQRAAMY